MSWADSAIDFLPDGGWRDIYVKAVADSDWETTYRWLLASYPHSFHRDGIEVASPSSVADIWHEQALAHCLLTLDANGLLFNCHFFRAADLEFDINPSQVVDEAHFSEVIGFMRRVGRLVFKQVILTYENDQSELILEYRPHEDSITHHQATWR